MFGRPFLTGVEHSILREDAVQRLRGSCRIGIVSAAAAAAATEATWINDGEQCRQHAAGSLCETFSRYGRL